MNTRAWGLQSIESQRVRHNLCTNTHKSLILLNCKGHIFWTFFSYISLFVCVCVCANLRKNIKLDADAQLHASYFKPKCPQFSTLLQLQGNGENYTDFTLKYLFNNKVVNLKLLLNGSFPLRY